jgi:prepilin-type processing-associated H-X9-DG protein
LIDEHEKSINDVLFLVAMPTLGAPTVDAPATRHNRGYGLSFCDGHSEIYKIRDTRTAYPLTSSAISGNSDYAKLQNVTTVHK